MSNINDLEQNILVDISHAKSFQDLQLVKIRELGKKGRISSLMKSLSTVSNEEKKSSIHLENFPTIPAAWENQEIFQKSIDNLEVNFNCIEPVGYLDMIKLINNCTMCRNNIQLSVHNYILVFNIGMRHYWEKI